jgi:hypothetical protein
VIDYYSNIQALILIRGFYKMFDANRDWHNTVERDWSVEEAVLMVGTRMDEP